MYLRRLYDLPVLSVAGHFVNNLIIIPLRNILLSLNIITNNC
ncbi:hypothetical protein YPPY56_3998 [Yersinia pestis PY-56]|nr:hypothetical protein YPPY56_3998 [Yersinia pestis PY-56]